MFSLAAQIAQVTRSATCKGETRYEVVYLITSLTPAQANPHRLMILIRSNRALRTARIMSAMSALAKITHASAAGMRSG
jgi:hypothetical protein